MLLTKTVKMKWNPNIKKYYEQRDYVFTKIGDEFEAKIEDLPDGSHVLVDVECDGCGELRGVIWQHYIDLLHEGGKYYCQKCASKLFGAEKQIKTKLEKSKSFYQWCYENLSKELSDYILSRWDYSLNVKNGKILTPKDVGFSSMGFNKKGYWFKCLDHPEHKSELKSISSFTNGQMGSINCNQCNTVAATHPSLIKYLINKEDAKKYSYGSNTKIPMKCPNCGHEKNLNFNTLVVHGFACPKCSDGVSYPEKFCLSFLEQLKIVFQKQLTKTTFKWCGTYRYDFYIDKFDGIIIELQGNQHYEEVKGNWKMSLEKIQEKDFDKECLARENKIQNYIVIDCRESNMEWIKNNIIKSRLPMLLGFKENDIDWTMCHEAGCKSLVKIACDLWNSGIKSTSKIADTLKIHSSTVSRYLKQGVKLEWCDYDPKKSIQTKVVCLTTNEIFNSIIEGANKYNITNNYISSCCLGKQKSAGKHPETGEKLIWMYYNEYTKIIS